MFSEKCRVCKFGIKLNVMRTDQQKYCFSCGQTIDSRSELCPSCGVPQPDAPINKSISSKWIAALLLSIIFGVFGIHRFFLGRIGTGLLMLFTAGGLGIWYVVDIILVITGNLKDQNGNLVTPTI